MLGKDTTPAADPQYLRGTLDLILLEVLSRGAMYGYQIVKAVNGRTGGYFDLREGSLYPALHKLERSQLLKASWVESPEGRRRKYYELTPRGADVLERKRRQWIDFASALSRLVEPGNVRS